MSKNGHERNFHQICGELDLLNVMYKQLTKDYEKLEKAGSAMNDEAGKSREKIHSRINEVFDRIEELKDRFYVQMNEMKSDFDTKVDIMTKDIHSIAISHKESSLSNQKWLIGILMALLIQIFVLYFTLKG